MKITRDSRKVDKRQLAKAEANNGCDICPNLFVIILDMVLLTMEFHVEHTHITIGRGGAKTTINATPVAQNGKASGIETSNNLWEV